jgi:hypothetical protein
VLPRYLAVMPVARVALGLDGGDVIPLSLCDDITDDVFRAGFGSGSGVCVSQGDDRKVRDGSTLVAFVLEMIGG